MRRWSYCPYLNEEIRKIIRTFFMDARFNPSIVSQTVCTVSHFARVGNVRWIQARLKIKEWPVNQLKVPACSYDRKIYTYRGTLT